MNRLAQNAEAKSPPGVHDVSAAQRLAFERLLGDLSARFADLPRID